jgi:hypothetical protein
MGETITVDEREAQEELFARGLTDGLPVIPPTTGRVEAMLAAVGADDPALLVGFLPARRRGVTLEKAAANAVMAGCLPEHFPVVIAALEAMFDPAFNLGAVLTSTGGAAVCAIVSGPIATAIGMNARENVLGPGNRANATIGRALRLIALNALGSRPGESDASSFGHPGKFTFCFAEDPPPVPWEPLRVQLGYLPGDTTVTVLPSESPHQIAHQMTRRSESVLRTCAAVIRSPGWFATGKRGQGVLVLGPEHAGFCVDDGWTQRGVRELLYEESRVLASELTAVGVELERGTVHDMTPAADGKLDTLASPDDVFLVTAGREGAGWSVWIPNWAPVQHARAVTRRVRPQGEPLPDCGPDGCLVPWASA